MNTELLAQCEKTIDKCLMDALTGYQSPLTNAVKDALTGSESILKELAAESVSSLVNSDEFRSVMKTEIKRKLAKVLISQYGGEIEKTIGKLKADPTSRAKMTIAIDSVMDELTNHS